ncbi:MAG: porin [Candidatus Methylumidiphilus sp.]
MTKHTKPVNIRLRPLAVGLSLALMTGGAWAAEPIPAGETVPEVEPTEEASGAFNAAGLKINDTKFMKQLGVTLGGWAQAGITYNSTSPDNNFNGPVTFGDRSAEFQLNQLYLFLQKAVATEGDAFSFGWRADFMFGTDSIFTQAYGVPAYDVNDGTALTRSQWDLNFLRNTQRFYDIAFPQVYLEAYVPVGTGLNLKLGHFYTPIGYEVVTSPDNFFYTHAYTMQYGEPFTHTGLLANYTFDKNWSTVAGLLTGSATGGWDGGFDQQLGNWSGLIGGTWNTEDKATSFNLTGTYGGVSERHSSAWAMYSMVFKHNLLDNLHMVVQHDHGFANGVLLNGANTDAEWYGINSYLMYDIMDNLGIGVRGEWFRDDAGFRVCSPGRIAAGINVDSAGNAYSNAGNLSNVTCQPASWYAFTVGLNYKPLKWLTLRPNVRYDWVDGSMVGPGNVQTGAVYKPFGNGPAGDAKDSQFLFSADAVIVF